MPVNKTSLVLMSKVEEKYPMNVSKKMLFTLITGAAILTQLLSPIRVFADGETPLPPVATLEATEPPVLTDVPTEIPATVIPAASDAPTVEPVNPEIPILTPNVTESSTPAPMATVVEQDLAPTEEPTLLETLQEIPNETSIVVLDENAQALPLATQETAEAVANGDPLWCPDGVTPIANTGGCTASYLTMNALLTNSATYINGVNVNGTIWITSGIIGDVIPITINGSIY